MPRTEALAAFRIYGSDLDPDEITARTGISPSETWRKGDVERKGAAPAPTHGWCINSRLPRDRTVEDHASDILSQIDAGNEAALREISGGRRVLTCILYIYGGDRPSVWLPSETVRRYSALSAEFDVDLYPFRDDWPAA